MGEGLLWKWKVDLGRRDEDLEEEGDWVLEKHGGDGVVAAAAIVVVFDRGWCQKL